MNHHGIIGSKQLVQSFTTGCVNLDDLGVHVIGHGECCPDSRLSAAHDNDVVHVLVVFLAYNLPDIGNILAGGHEISQVMKL